MKLATAFLYTASFIMTFILTYVITSLMFGGIISLATWNTEAIKNLLIIWQKPSSIFYIVIRGVFLFISLIASLH